MNTQQKQNLDDLFKQINVRLAIIGKTPDAYFMMQLIEILKNEIAKNTALQADFKSMAAQYQTLIIDLAPHLLPDQIHMVGSRTGAWFCSMADDKYLVRNDPRENCSNLRELSEKSDQLNH